MPGTGHSRTQRPEIGPSRERGHHTKRTLAQSVQRALQSRRDVFRGGSPSEIIDMLGEDASGTVTQDELLLELEDEFPPDATEISLADEDDLESDLDFPLHWTSDDARPRAEDARLILSDTISIVVVDERATFRAPPDWALGIADRDLSLRWETFTAIAEWLNRDRRDFLRHPSYLSLVKGSVDLAGPVPVLQAGLHDLLGLSCNKSTFSKHVRCGVIQWPSRVFPLEWLFCGKARLAWCAQAARQRQEMRGYAPKNSPLGDPSIQPPGGSKDRASLRNKAGKAMGGGPVEFVQVLCILANGVAWRDVLDQYSDFIFYRE